jgi:hypothetical protein
MAPKPFEVMECIADLDSLNFGQWIGLAVIGGTALMIVGGILRVSRQMRAKERFENGQCVQCGYDLRASDGRCPECGFPIQPPSLPLTLSLQVKSLREDWPKNDVKPRQHASNEYLVEVYSADPEVVQMLANQLEVRGISASIRTSTFGSGWQYYGKSEKRFGSLSVWSGDVDRSIAIIRSFGDAQRHSHLGTEHSHHSPKHSVHEGSASYDPGSSRHTPKES